METVFHVCIAWYKHERGWENSRQLYKPETKSRVCITVENSPNPSSVYISLCKHRKKVFYCFYKITSSKNYNAGKDKNSFYWSKRIFLEHWFDNGISQLTNQTLYFENLVIGDVECTTLHHTTMFTYSHANTPLGQLECAYYLSYFIKKNNKCTLQSLCNICVGIL